MEKFDSRAGDMERGAVSQVVDLAKASEKVQFVVVWKYAMYLGSPNRILIILQVLDTPEKAVFCL